MIEQAMKKGLVMTDKELLGKVRAEIERRKKEVIDNIFELGNSESERIGLFDRKEIYDDLLSFINSMEKEPVSEDLGDYINELSKQFPEVSFAKLSRIAVRVAKWQKQHLWKPADGDDLPEIDREVIAILDNGKVVFAHRPPEFWDGKDIVTGKVTRHYPKTYDKGGWNIPNVKYWLDVELPKEMGL